MIKAIIFDLYNVVFQEGFTRGIKKYARRHNFDYQQIYRAIHDIPQWEQFSKGEISEGKYWQVCSKSLKYKINPEEIRKDIAESSPPISGVLPFIKTLKSKFKLAIISNSPREWLDLMDEKYSFIQYFDIISVSGLTGKRKPEKAAYEYVTKKLRIEPSECLYIDDRQKYVEIALSFGFKALKFETVGKLKKIVSKL